MKKMKLGMKIGMGFGILIILACVLGGVGVWNMNSVERESSKLANEYVPEVSMAVDLRGAANRLMYEMRGYGFTEEKAYYNRAQQEFRAVEKALQEGRELDKRAVHLKKLKGQLDAATNALGKYKGAVEQTVEITEKMAGNRKTLDEAAAKYMANGNDFLAGQNKAFKRDLSERQAKIAYVTKLVDIGSSARVMNFKSQATADPELMDNAIIKVGEAGGVIGDLRKITRDAEDLRRIDETQKAAKGYQQAMRNFLVEFKKGSRANSGIMDKYRGSMDTNAGIYVKNCADFLDGQQKKLTTDMTERNAKITIVNDIIDIGNATRIAAFKSQAMRDPKIIEEAVSNFGRVDKMFEDVLAITRLDADIQRIGQIKVAGKQYKNAMVNFLANWRVLQDLGKQRGEAGAQVIEATKILAAAGIGATDQIAKGAVESLSAAGIVMIIGLIVAAIVGVVVAVFITRGITKPVNRIIGALDEGSNQVASASSQVATSSQQLAEGSAEQAASLEETSSSLEEMASMTKQNADNANQADNLMKDANRVIVQANDSMGQLTTSMQEISTASEETSKIIKTIDEIAFQTNLLALNAAVEAARAGEAGAGFAVVADEVRNLALRASDAAKNTADLIEGTVNKVKDGSELVTKTNDAFTEVATSATKVGELVGEISAASNEQAQGIDEVNKAMTEMDKIVQSSAANAEESASASEEMNAQAEQMKGVVNELAVLVGGAAAAASQQGQVAQAVQHLRTGGTHAVTHHKALAAPTQTKRARTAQVKRAAAPKATAKDVAAAKAQEVKPEEVIPMDDEAEFKDF